MEALNSDRDVEPIGNQSPNAAPYGCYPCRGEDRWCVIGVETDEQWRALARAFGRPELAGDPRFSCFSARKAGHDELDRLIEAWTRERHAYQVMDRLQSLGVPCGVVQSGRDLVEDEHLIARGFLVEQENSRIGRVILPGFPIKFARCAIKPRWEFPELGRDNEPVFRDLLGYSSERIVELAREGIVE